MDGVNSFSCNCSQGYFGKICHNGTDECVPNPCQNAANCTDLHLGYKVNFLIAFNVLQRIILLHVCAIFVILLLTPVEFRSSLYFAYSTPFARIVSNSVTEQCEALSQSEGWGSHNKC